MVVAAVWGVHGFYNKLLQGAPRHLSIVQALPGLEGASGERVLVAVGIAEVGLACWVLSGRWPRWCAAVQTCALLAMNALELTYARHLLLWPAGLVPVNLAFLAVAWVAAADRRVPVRLRTRLRRHPLAIEAHLRDCLTITYALPAAVLRPLLPPGLELDAVGDHGFVAVALVRAESLRPSGLPPACGQDFFLAGYRVFATFRRPDGRIVRGLRILRSDTDRTRMVVGGNLLTHYNYHRCSVRTTAGRGRIAITVGSGDGRGDLDLSADLTSPQLPPLSPFPSVRAARRFAGPLPYTFDYEAETHAIVAINGRRTGWQPVPVAVDVRRISFFDQPAFAGCTPIVAAAFHVSCVDYRWERGVRYPLESTGPLEHAP